jgi:SAM-dependent methyltransferase
LALRETVFIEDYYADGEWYDAEYVHIGGDVPYYQKVAEESEGKVLELACGTGRLTFPMMETGARVHGIDLSTGMLKRAQAKREDLRPSQRMRVTFSQGDMRNVRLGETFGSVVLAFNTLMHMTEDDDLLDTLQTARAHLGPEGLFHLDLHTPFPEINENRDPEGRYDPEEMIDPRNGDRYIVTENNQYDARQQINEMRFYFQKVDREGMDIGAERCAVLRLRVLFPRELDTFLRLAGFEVVGDWDDFERSTCFSGGGGRRVLMAQPLPSAPTIVLP